MRYACLLDFLSEYHYSVSDAFKKEASTYKAIAARIFQELPIDRFQQLLGDQEITTMILECSCVQIAMQPRFAYLVQRLWESSVHKGERSERRGLANDVKAFVDAPRFRFFSFMAAQLCMNFYLHFTVLTEPPR